LKYIKLSIITATFVCTAGVSTLRADWTNDGILLGTAGGAQVSPVVTADGTGGAVIVWTDSRNPVNSDIYAQGVTADGAIRWYPNGMACCTASNYQSNPMIVSDGSGNTIVVWQDLRSGSTVDIYAQKLDIFGYGQWASNGVAICTGKTNLVLGGVIPDGSGGAIIAWQDRRDFTNGVFAQRIDAGGNVLWTTNGVTVSSEAGHQQAPALASDGSGGAIIAWEDRRSGNYDIYAQRIDASGAAQWTAGGNPVCSNDQNQTTVRVVEDGAGGAVIAWSDRRNMVDFDIFAQRVNASGALQWVADIPAGAWMYDQTDCRLLPVGSAETIVAWIDGRSGTKDIYAQKLDANGNSQWGFGGMAVCGASGDQNNVRIATNGAGGAFISWDDARNGTTNCDIYAQNVGSDGTPAWTSDGKEICGAAANQTVPAICEDGSNGTFVAWADNRSGTIKSYGHRVDAAGDIPAATVLQAYDAQAVGADIRVDWTLSEIDEGVVFRVFRSGEQGVRFVEIPSIELNQDGLCFWFVDGSCEPAATYRYRVTYEFGAESGVLFETGPVTTAVTALVLQQNLPNPFNPNTVIGYYVPERSRVRLEVFDVEGRTVTVLVDGFQAEGAYREYWNGRYADGSEAASGVYFYRLQSGKKTLTRKMILIR
jgi:hypothetical protein